MSTQHPIFMTSTTNVCFLSLACHLFIFRISIHLTALRRPSPVDRRLRRHIDLQHEQGEETEGEAGSKREEVNDLQERMAGVAARAAVVCSYEEEARQVEQLTRMLNDNLRTLENDRLKGMSRIKSFLVPLLTSHDVHAEVPIMMRELKPIEAVHWDQMEAASLLNNQFNELLNSYNDLVHSRPVEAEVTTLMHRWWPRRSISCHSSFWFGTSECPSGRSSSVWHKKKPCFHQPRNAERPRTLGSDHRGMIPRHPPSRMIRLLQRSPTERRAHPTSNLADPALNPPQKQRQNLLISKSRFTLQLFLTAHVNSCLCGRSRCTLSPQGATCRG